MTISEKSINQKQFDSEAALAAVEVQNKLKKHRKSIDQADLFIAATAIVHDLHFDTLNHKHFEYIEDLKMTKSDTTNQRNLYSFITKGHFSK